MSFVTERSFLLSFMVAGPSFERMVARERRAYGQMLYAPRMEQGRGPGRYYRRLDLTKPIPPWPDRWGRWTLDAEHLVLRNEENYSVDLKRFPSAAPMLDMIAQVRHKVFLTTTDVGDFVAALDDIFDIQSTLVPQGVDGRIDDVPAFLRKRIAARAPRD